MQVTRFQDRIPIFPSHLPPTQSIGFVRMPGRWESPPPWTRGLQGRFWLSSGLHQRGCFATTHDGLKADVDPPRMSLGPISGSAVRLAPTTDRVCLTEGVEDALALMQIMRTPAWCLLGKGGFKTVELSESIRTVILAPDGDKAGQDVIPAATDRLVSQGREVWSIPLPAGLDWNDILETFEERAAILEFDGDMTREEAEELARREVLGG